MPYRDYTWDEDRWNDTGDEQEPDIEFVEPPKYHFKDWKDCPHCDAIIYYSHKTLRCPNCGKTI